MHEMKTFVSNHPWMTFFLGLAALNTVGYVVGGPTVITIPKPAPAAPPAGTLTSGVLDHPMMAWSKPITHFARQGR